MEEGAMNSRRITNEHLTKSSGGSTPSRIKAHVPSKTDLFNLLNGFHSHDSPDVAAAEAVLAAAKKARREFEVANEKWMRLRRAEKRAQRNLERAEERARKEIRECRMMLRLHGVNEKVVERIERLVCGEDE